MKSLLLVNASGRTSRSITRHLTTRYSDGWNARYPTGEIVRRDLGIDPPPAVNEAWIAAAFADPAAQTAPMAQALSLSETLIGELVRSDAIVLGAPMYNFGMPAQLKAYVDQIVRIGRTFAFDPTHPTDPYRPLLSSKPVLIVVSAGDGALHPGGAMAHLNFLEPHLRTVFEFIGLSNLSFVRVGYDEHQDNRFRRSLSEAESAVDHFLEQLP